MAEEDKAESVLSLLTEIRIIHQALLRSTSETELFQEICDSLKRISKFVWIGLVEKGNYEVKPVAQAGFEEGYLSSIKVTWDDSEHGRGPTGTAIKTGLPFVMTDIENDPRYQPWREQAMKRGYKSSAALPLMHEGETIGALNVYSEEKDAFGEGEVTFLMDVAADICIGVKALRLAKELEQRCEELKGVLDGVVESFAIMSETRDPYTAGHQRRVAQLASAIAKEIDFSKEQVEGIRVAGLLHDIGKIAVPAEILSKPGKISEYEFSIIKTHSQAGHEILKGVGFPWPVAQVVLQHHERLDGSGYPLGLFCQDILLEARILGVADVVEAMSSHRPYRPALGIDNAIREISQKKGVLYDSEVVQACVKLFQEKGFEFR